MSTQDDNLACELVEETSHDYLVFRVFGAVVIRVVFSQKQQQRPHQRIFFWCHKTRALSSCFSRCFRLNLMMMMN